MTWCFETYVQPHGPRQERDADDISDVYIIARSKHPSPGHGGLCFRCGLQVFGDVEIYEGSCTGGSLRMRALRREMFYVFSLLLGAALCVGLDAALPWLVSR